jgi:hypothetical protein
VLRTDEALQAFCSSAHLGLGGTASASLGPVGRCAQAGLQLAAGGGGSVVGYSCSRGAFVGVSIEGSLFVMRDAANLSFYGERGPWLWVSAAEFTLLSPLLNPLLRPRHRHTPGYKTTARQILIEGSVPQPPAASMLYEGLHQLMQRYEDSNFAVHVPPARVASASAALEGPAASASAAAAAATVAARSADAGRYCESDDSEPDEAEEEQRQWERQHQQRFTAAPHHPLQQQQKASEAGEAAPEAADGLGTMAAAAAMRVLRGAAAAAASGAAALATTARGAAAGRGEEGGGFITGSVGEPIPRPARATKEEDDEAAYSSQWRPRSAPQAASAFGEEFRLPAAPRHMYESYAYRLQEGEGEEEEQERRQLEPQYELSWD